MPLISVVIPVYNKAQFLPECLDSVLSQTYKDFEIVLVDDGSKDDSLSICQQYAESCPAIKVFHQENSGASAARNLGIDVAKGKWCTFIDADDTVKSHYLSDLVDHIVSDSSLVMSNMEYGQDAKVSDFPEENCIGAESIREYIWNNSIACHLGPCVKLFNREILNRNEIRFPKDVTNGEDAIFVFEYLSSVEMLSVFESRNYIYREVAGSLSNKTPHSDEALNNYIRLRDSWLSFMNLSIEDSKAWINSSIHTKLNIFVKSIFADKRYGFSYRLSQVKKYREELLAMYNYSEYKSSTIGRISSVLLGSRLYILYIMCYYLFVRYNLREEIG